MGSKSEPKKVDISSQECTLYWQFWAHLSSARICEIQSDISTSLGGSLKRLSRPNIALFPSRRALLNAALPNSHNHHSCEWDKAASVSYAKQPSSIYERFSRLKLWNNRSWDVFQGPSLLRDHMWVDFKDSTAAQTRSKLPIKCTLLRAIIELFGLS